MGQGGKRIILLSSNTNPVLRSWKAHMRQEVPIRLEEDLWSVIIHTGLGQS